MNPSRESLQESSDPFFKAVINLMARWFDVKRDLSPEFITVMSVELLSSLVFRKKIEAYGKIVVF